MERCRLDRMLLNHLVRTKDCSVRTVRMHTPLTSLLADGMAFPPTTFLFLHKTRFFANPKVLGRPMTVDRALIRGLPVPIDTKCCRARSSGG